jgi:hypothetical protein
MDSMSGSPIWRYVTARLAGLDHITRREVLLRLLRDGTFLALLTAEAAEATGAAEKRKGVSAQALTASAPDNSFAVFRTELTEGKRAAVDQALRHAAEGARSGTPGVVFVPSGTTERAACGGAFSCGTNTCTTQDCGGTNTCDKQTCDRLGCQGKNTCDRQGCDKLSSALTVGGLLSKYGNTQFVMELRQVFGSDVEHQVDQMLRTKATLRQRGLIESHAAPKPKSREEQRDLGGTPGKPAPGGAQPPVRRSP